MLCVSVEYARGDVDLRVVGSFILKVNFMYKIPITIFKYNSSVKIFNLPMSLSLPHKERGDHLLTELFYFLKSI